MSALRAIDGQHLFYSGWHLYRPALSSTRKTQRDPPPLSLAQKSVSMTTLVSKLPSHFCQRGWHKVSYHYFFSHLHLASAAFSSTSLPPIELSCTITAPIILLKLCLLLSLIFLSLIAIYFPKQHPWVKMGNISEEIETLTSRRLQVKFIFSQRHEILCRRFMAWDFFSALPSG